MEITDSLLLPPDVLLVPVAELPDEVRGKLTHDEGDYAISRPRSRTPSRIVDAQAAELLREFGSPRTIVDAVIRFARARGASPEATLDEAYPLLERLLGAGFLVAEGADDAGGIHASLARGDHAGRWEVVAAVQVLEDTEIYQATDGERIAALKIERPGGPRSGIAAALAREVAALTALDGAVTPVLLDAGEHAGRRFLAGEWCSGADAEAAARELRQETATGRGGRRSRDSLLALCSGIAAAYARLHESGWVHGDVHPRNVLVGAGGEIRLIDFGLAAAAGPRGEMGADSADSDTGGARGGIGFFFEPEYARSVAAGRGGRAIAVPPATVAGEQYAVAALLYHLAAGAHYLDFSLEQEEMLRQIAEEPPLPFADRGAEPWPALEAVLGRGLAKAPAARYPSLAAMAAALAALAAIAPAAEPAAAPPPRPAADGSGASPVRVLLGAVLAEVDAGGSLVAVSPPTASIFFGAGGVACALYRLALQRDDAGLLALADLWLTRAEGAAGDADAFLDPEMELTAEMAGKVSPYHTPCGLAALRSLLATAQGDAAGALAGAAAFTRLGLEWIDGAAAAGHEGAGRGALPPGTANPDLTLGRSGLLLAAAQLGDVLPAGAAERARLADLSGRVLAGLWAELDRLPPIAAQPAPPNLGIAHGWAGYAYAALRWCRVFGGALPAGLAARLAELAAAAEPWGRGLRWRWNPGQSGGEASTMPGWCNGSAGFVFLWTLAHRELGEPRFLELATGAAWNAWEAPEGGGSICCGTAGRAYALLDLARHLGGDSRWLARASALADRAALAIAAGSEKQDSLFKGRIGVALLAAELERPESAALPFFADEGWRTGA